MPSSSTETYVIDTSSIIDLLKYYPPSSIFFKRLWDRLTENVESGNLLITEPMVGEFKGRIEAKTTEEGQVFLPRQYLEKEVKFFSLFKTKQHRIDQQALDFAYKIRKDLGIGETDKNGISDVDAKIISYAKNKLAVVISEEERQPDILKTKPHNYKIPAVCKKFGIRCVDISEYVRLIEKPPSFSLTQK